MKTPSLEGSRRARTSDKRRDYREDTTTNAELELQTGMPSVPKFKPQIYSSDQLRESLDSHLRSLMSAVARKLDADEIRQSDEGFRTVLKYAEARKQHYKGIYEEFNRRYQSICEALRKMNTQR